MSIETFSRDVLRKELEADEGRRRFAYKDDKGNLTIGVGWNLTANGLPDHIIDQLLDISIDRAMADLDVLEQQWKEFDPDRQRVMLNWVFQCGRNVAGTFHRFLAAVNQFLNGDSEAALDRAAFELEMSGLAPARRKRLADRMRAHRA